MCLTTTAAGAQSLSAPDAHQLTGAATKAAQPVVQAVKQSVPSVAKAAQPVTQAAHQAASSVATAASNATKAVKVPQPPALPTPTVQIPHAELHPLVDETVDAVTDTAFSVEKVAEAVAPAETRPAVHDVATAANDAVPAVADEVAQEAVDTVVEVAPIVADVVTPVAPASVASTARQPTLAPTTHFALTAAHEDPSPIGEITPVDDQPMVDADEPVEVLVVVAPSEATPTASTNLSVLGMPPLADWDVITPAESVVVDEPHTSLTLSTKDVAQTSPPATPSAPLSAPIGNQPSSPTTALPVSSGTVGSTSSSAMGWLPLAELPVSLQAKWVSLHQVGRRLPSVIVLPNLAPPG